MEDPDPDVVMTVESRDLQLEIKVPCGADPAAVVLDWLKDKQPNKSKNDTKGTPPKNSKSPKHGKSKSKGTEDGMESDEKAEAKETDVLQLTPTEVNKMKWMNAREPVQPVICKQLHNLRFDLSGSVCTDGSDPALYHHGGSPDTPGYTVSELMHLAQSTLSSQSAMALGILAHVFRNARHIVNGRRGFGYGWNRWMRFMCHAMHVWKRLPKLLNMKKSYKDSYIIEALVEATPMEPALGMELAYGICTDTTSFPGMAFRSYSRWTTEALLGDDLIPIGSPFVPVIDPVSEIVDSSKIVFDILLERMNWPLMTCLVQRGLAVQEPKFFKRIEIEVKAALINPETCPKGLLKLMTCLVQTHARPLWSTNLQDLVGLCRILTHAVVSKTDDDTFERATLATRFVIAMATHSEFNVGIEARTLGIVLAQGWETPNTITIAMERYFRMLGLLADCCKDRAQDASALIRSIAATVLSKVPRKQSSNTSPATMALALSVLITEGGFVHCQSPFWDINTFPHVTEFAECSREDLYEIVKRVRVECYDEYVCMGLFPLATLVESARKQELDGFTTELYTDLILAASHDRALTVVALHRITSMDLDIILKACGTGTKLLGIPALDGLMVLGVMGEALPMVMACLTFFHLPKFVPFQRFIMWALEVVVSAPFSEEDPLVHAQFDQLCRQYQDQEPLFLGDQNLYYEKHIETCIATVASARRLIPPLIRIMFLCGRPGASHALQRRLWGTKSLVNMYGKMAEEDPLYPWSLEGDVDPEIKDLLMKVPKRGACGQVVSRLVDSRD